MPIYQDYPDIGLNYTTESNLSKNIRPQFEVNFTSMPNGVIPAQTNGSKTLDPAAMYDFSSFTGGTVATITDGRLGSNPVSTVGFFSPITETGYYFQADILPSSSWVVDIYFLDINNVRDGYGLVVDSSDRTMKIYTCDTNRTNFTIHGTEQVDVSASDQSHLLTFKWDGNRRFQGTYRNEELLVQITDADPVNLISSILVESNVVKSIAGGASEYFTNLTPNGPARGISYGNISFSGSNVDWPGTVSGFIDAEDDGGASLSSAISALTSEGISPVFTFDYSPGVYSDTDFPGNVAEGQIRVGAATNDMAKFESGATPATVGLNYHIYADFSTFISDARNDCLNDIANNRIPHLILTGYNMASGWESDTTILDPDYEDIINEILDLDHIIFMSINPLPEVDVIGNPDDYIPSDWLAQQIYFKYKLRHMNAKHVSFSSVHVIDFYTGAFPEIIVEDFWNDGVWDFLSVFYSFDGDITIDPTPYLPHDFLVKINQVEEYAKTKDKKIQLAVAASDIDDAATPGSGDLGDLFTLIYDYCIDSPVGATPNVQIFSLIYNELTGYPIPDPSDTLDAFINLLVLPESVDSATGVQERADILALPADEKLSDYGDAVAEIMATYPASMIFVWKFDREVVNENDYQTLFAQLAESLDPSTRIFGPNVYLTARGEGYDQSYNGVLVDSRDMDILQNFIDLAEAATPQFRCDGIAFCGNFDASDWPDIIDYVKSITNLAVAVTDVESFDATPDDLAETRAKTEAVVTSLASTDFVFIPSGENDFFSIPNPDFAGVQWRFEGQLVIPAPGALNAKLSIKAYSEDILGNSYTSLEGGLYEFQSRTPISGQILDLGSIDDGTYDLIIYGDVLKSGNASLRVGFSADNLDEVVVSDSIYLNYVEDSNLSGVD